MQASPDWIKIYSEKSFSDDLGLDFNGPGFYLTDINTILVVPRTIKGVTIDNVWHHTQPKGTIYEVHIYNVPFHETIFAASAVAPVRFDNR